MSDDGEDYNTEGDIPDVEANVQGDGDDGDGVDETASHDGFQTGSDTDVEGQSAPVNTRAGSEDQDLVNRANFDDADEYAPGAAIGNSKPKKAAGPADDLASQEDGEDQALNQPLTSGKKMVDEEAKEEKDKRRKLAGFLGIVAAFIVLLVLLVLFFKPDEGETARAQFSGNSTSPTWSPTESTESPTVFPTTSKPTVSEGKPTEAPSPQPTYSPTVAFTLTPGDPDISRLPCDIIKTQDNVTWGNYGENNFKYYKYNDVEVCADTWGGTDPDHPDRSQWSVKLGRRNCPTLGYRAGFAMCDFVGARWCTIDEMTQLVGQGTGCGGDRDFVFSNTDCTNNGVQGKYMFDLGLRDSRQPYFKCETDLTTPSVIRCCGDNY